MGSTNYVRYDQPGVEPPVEGEEALGQEIISLINSTQQKNFSMHRHYMRGTHVKTQAIVKGKLTIQPNLAPELAHGIASAANAQSSHPIAMRFANEPSWLQDDRSPGPRGCSMKIFNVSGDFMDPKGSSTETQDLTFNNAPVLELRDAQTCVEIFRIRERHFREPEKIPAELAKRKDATLQAAPAQLPNHHFMGYTFYSQSAYRWGPYVAKYALFPTGDLQSRLGELKKVSNSSEPEQHSLWLKEFFAENDATFDLRVQLCQDLEAQSVEDTSVEWDESKYPFETVGQVVLDKGQDPMDAVRRQAWDDGMHLNVWYGLEDHRPLGSANRLRKQLYQASRMQRERGNARETKYISSVDEIP